VVITTGALQSAAVPAPTLTFVANGQIVNPAATGTVAITVNASNGDAQGSANVTITAGGGGGGGGAAVTGGAVGLTSSTVGANTAGTVAFTLGAALAPASTITLTFPAGWTMTTGAMTVGNWTGLDAAPASVIGDNTLKTVTITLGAPQATLGVTLAIAGSSQLVNRTTPGVGVSIGIAATGQTAGTSNVFTIVAGAPAAYTLTGPATVAAGAASTNFTIAIQDAFGNSVNTTQNTTFTLASTAAGTVTFNPVSPVTVTTGTSSVTFTYTATQAGAKTITATRASGDAVGGPQTANITVNAGAASKLQLLVPGETASAGSVTGKTGAPSAQTTGTAFTVTVNMVDANWNVVTSTDTVGITSTDGGATLPANAALVAGTKTFSVTLNTVSTPTITATDITNGARTASTSPAITVSAPPPPPDEPSTGGGPPIVLPVGCGEHQVSDGNGGCVCVAGYVFVGIKCVPGVVPLLLSGPTTSQQVLDPTSSTTRLTASATATGGTGPLNYAWTINGITATNGTVPSSGSLSLSLNRADIARLLGVSETGLAGTVLTVRASVTSSDSPPQTVSKDLNVTFGAPPSGGPLSVSPSSGTGTEAGTRFTLDAGSWTGASALTYQFYADRGAVSFIVRDFSSASTFTGALPVGDASNGSQLTVGVIVRDASGLTATSTVVVVVAEPPVASCQPGSFSATGKEPCTPAPKGRYVSVAGAIEAVNCAPGSYSDVEGATSCKPAQAGYYVANSGAMLQLPCPPDQNSVAGATSCYGALTSAAVTLSPATATATGATTTVTFNTPVAIPSGGKIKVTLPGFTWPATPVTTFTAPSALANSTSVAGSVLTVTVAGGAPAGAVTFSGTGATLPAVQAARADVAMSVTTSADAVLASTSSGTLVAIVTPAVTRVVYRTSNSTPGAASTVTITFRLASLPDGGITLTPLLPGFGGTPAVTLSSRLGSGTPGYVSLDPTGELILGRLPVGVLTTDSDMTLEVTGLTNPSTTVPKQSPRRVHLRDRRRHHRRAGDPDR
jgi:hypothetical protein